MSRYRQELAAGDEAGAQQALDASGLTRLSCDGAVLMRAVGGAPGIGPLDLPWADQAPTAGMLAKAG